jgi:hypothetical protein
MLDMGLGGDQDLAVQGRVAVQEGDVGVVLEDDLLAVVGRVAADDGAHKAGPAADPLLVGLQVHGHPLGVHALTLSPLGRRTTSPNHTATWCRQVPSARQAPGMVRMWLAGEAGRIG